MIENKQVKYSILIIYKIEIFRRNHFYYNNNSKSFVVSSWGKKWTTYIWFIHIDSLKMIYIHVRGSVITGVCSVIFKVITVYWAINQMVFILLNKKARIEDMIMKCQFICDGIIQFCMYRFIISRCLESLMARKKRITRWSFWNNK